MAAAVTEAVSERMREKLKTEEGREVYKQRKLIVEPVFGQVKEADRLLGRLTIGGGAYCEVE